MNRLKDATSPYLLQHASNPVEWFEWGPAAFAEAARRDVPLLISVGYSACHWCHVMAHESFEDEATARLMNEHFVNVKVDREERPDVDAVYMSATQAMTGQGGWPMTVFATPQGHPFYTGTYFPRPHFQRLLTGVSNAWTGDRAAVLEQGSKIVEALNEQAAPPSGPLPTAATLTQAVENLRRSFDAEHGGFGGAPKFPPSMVLEFLLRYGAAGERSRRPGAAETPGAAPAGEGGPVHGEAPGKNAGAAHGNAGAAPAMAMAERTLEAMARGGIYDQLGGGFARYSVDARWVVPHFEKMLYDNALLLRVYTHWWRAGGSVLARRVALETADWLLAEMRTPEGGFASALDADSEGVEGRFYAWTPEEIREVLGEEDGPWAVSLFEVTGTFEHGTSVLQLPSDPGDAERFARVRAALLAARSRRVRPGRDDKVVAAAWRFLEPLLFGQVYTNKQAISSHYNADPKLFLSFLDPVFPAYSQGVYSHDNETLAKALERKFDWAIEKCELGPGKRVLEIGPGWGAFAGHALQAGVDFTGITIAEASQDFLRGKLANFGERFDILLTDFYDYEPDEPFDAIVIMGVIEHLPNYERVLRKFARLLKPGGLVFLDGSAATRKYELSTFMVRHIYPGNHSFLVLDDFLNKLAKTELEVMEVQNDRWSYFLTFRQWALNLEANKEYVRSAFGDFEYRKFRLYLWGAAYEFLARNLDCYRLILQKPGTATV